MMSEKEKKKTPFFSRSSSFFWKTSGGYLRNIFFMAHQKKIFFGAGQSLSHLATFIFFFMVGLEKRAKK